MAKFEFGGRVFDLVMSVHAMEAIEEEFGDIESAIDKFNRGGRNVKMIRSMFRILANAGQHKKREPEDVTGDEISDLDLAGLSALSAVLKRTMAESVHAETIKGGMADDSEYDIYAEELEKQQKNVKAGGEPGSESITDTP